jgi:hypothetical protein
MRNLGFHKVAPYRDNAMVASIVPPLKEKYRAAILARAKEAQTSL